MTNENEPLYVVCRNGVFTLPAALMKSLEAHVRNGFVYLRQDDDALTIATSRIADGRRRVLQARFRVPMFRGARRLAIVDLKESIRVMPVS
jgi:hypothetical protein